MKTNYILDNIRCEKLDDSHDVSKFKSNYEGADKFLKQRALDLQDTREPMTMLMMCRGKIIGYFTTWVPDIDLRDDVYDQLIEEGATPEHIEKLVACEIKSFVLDKKYDKKSLALPLFGKIYGVAKLIMRSITTDEPIEVVLGKYCKIPATDEDVMNEIKKVNEKLKHPFYMNIKGKYAFEF